MTFHNWAALLISAAALTVSPTSILAADSTSVVMPKTDLKWKDMGNGIAAAPVSGGMTKGASRFFLKYPVGLVTPKHHHSADHYVTVVSGTITLTVGRQGPQARTQIVFRVDEQDISHRESRRQGGSCVFIHRDAPWNVVMDK